MLKKSLLLALVAASVFSLVLYIWNVIETEEAKEPVETVHDDGKESYLGGQLVENFSLEGYDISGQKTWKLDGELAHIGGGTDVFIEKNVVLSIEDSTKVEMDKVLWKNDVSRFVTNLPVKVIHDKQVAEGIGAMGKVDDDFLQINQNIGMSLKGPILITCRGPFKIFRKENRAIFFRDVMISDTKGTLQSDRLDIFFTEDKRAIEKVVASEGVRIERDGNVSYSQEAIYNTTTQSVKLIGEPSIEIRKKRFDYFEEV